VVSKCITYTVCDTVLTWMLTLETTSSGGQAIAGALCLFGNGMATELSLVLWSLTSCLCQTATASFLVEVAQVSCLCAATTHLSFVAELA
jgi:hypothetical protein